MEQIIFQLDELFPVDHPCYHQQVRDLQEIFGASEVKIRIKNMAA